MRGFALLLVLLVLTGVWWVFDSVFAMKRAFTPKTQSLPVEIARGPGIEFTPGLGPVTYAVFTAAGAYMELDAGAGHTLDGYAMRYYHERNGQEGLQLPGDTVVSTMRVGPVRKGSRTDLLRSTTGFGSAALRERLHLSVEGRVKDGGSAQFLLGPGIELGDAAARDWQPLVVEPGGLAIHWRRAGESIELRAAQARAGAPLQAGTATVGGRDVPFVEQQDGWHAVADAAGLAGALRASVTLHAGGNVYVRLTPAAE